MYRKYLSDSVQTFVDVGALSDNTNKLYNIAGTLYFNGEQVGAGAEDNNAWVNANDVTTLTTANANMHSTYLTLTANDVTTLNTSNANMHSTYVTLKGLIDTVNDNVESGSGGGLSDSINEVQSNLTANNETLTSNLYNTWNSLEANTYDTYLTAMANDVTTLTTANANMYATYLTSAANDVATLTTANANIYNTWSSLEANTYDTWDTLNSSISSAGQWTTTSLLANIYYSGNVVIGLGSNYDPPSNLYVYGNTFVTGNVEVGDTLIELSSEAIKTNIVPLREQLSKINLLRPVEYDKIYTNNHEIGLIAEEVAEVLPYVVASGNSAISYTRIVPVLIQAVKELKEELDELKLKIKI